MFYTLIYVSEGTDVVEQTALDQIREQAIQLNQTAAVTGLLLHAPADRGPGYFCQLLQGSRVAVEQTMQRIKKDHRHKSTRVLLRTDFPEEMFPDWSMASSRLKAGEASSIIARTHSTGFADARDVDYIVGLMQQFRFNQRAERQAVKYRSREDRSLAAFSISAGDIDGLDSVLEMGALAFKGSDILLLLRQAGSAELRVYTTNSALLDGESRGLLGSPDNVHGMLEKKHKKYVESSDVVVDLPSGIAKVCDQNNYHSANGYLISLDVENASRSTGKADKYSVGAVWFMHKNSARQSHAVVIEEQQRFLCCIEDFLLKHRMVFENHLQKHSSNRQRLALTSSVKRQDLVINMVNSAIIVLDEDSRVLMLNDAARELFELEKYEVPFQWPEQVRFLNAIDQMPLDDDAQPIKKALKFYREKVAESNLPLQSKRNEAESSKIFQDLIVLLVPYNESEVKYLACSAVSVIQSDSAVAVVLVFDDITMLELNRTQRRSDRFEALEYMTSGIVHDFNNLLATSLNSLELARIQTDKAEQERLIQLAIDTVHRGTDLVNRLVAFSARQPIVPEVRPLSDVLRAVEHLAQSQCPDAVRLYFDRVDKRLAVNCDHAQLENALLNLIINSRDAILSSGIGTMVRIAVRELSTVSSNSNEAADIPDDSVQIEITVVDDGPGMTSSLLRRATDPFFTTKTKKAGSGLGLSMVYRFMQQCMGELRIENNARGSGLNVRMIIDQAPITVSRIDRHGQPVYTQEPSGHRVMLVEDDVQFGELIKKMLLDAGHDVTYVPMAVEALQLIADKKTFDLLITDVMMNDSAIDGIDLADRAVGTDPTLKVIYITGYVEHDQMHETTLHGPVLHKPVSIAKIRSTIQQQLGSAGRQATACESTD